MEDTHPNPSLLTRRATYGDSAELLESLVEFILAMFGVEGRIKAGVKLGSSIAKKLAAAFDEQSESSAPAPASGNNPPAATTPEAPSLREINLRLLLDSLSIKSITLDRSALLKLLQNHTLIGLHGGICASTAAFAKAPFFWTSEPAWVATTLADAELAVLREPAAFKLRLRVPHARLDTGGSIDVSVEQHASDLENEKQIIVHNKRVQEGHRLAICTRYLGDLRPSLQEFGIQLIDESPLRGFSVTLSDADHSTSIFTLALVLPENHD